MNQLTITQWQEMTSGDRETYSRQLVDVLPTGFVFRKIDRYELGLQKHEVALFEFAGAIFALIPSAEVILGYDPNRFWEPSSEELESWNNTCVEYGISRSIHEQIAAVTLRPRMVRVGSMLVETSPRELGWETICPDTPEIKNDIESCKGYLIQSSKVIAALEGASLRVSQNASGIITAEICRHPTHGELCRVLLESSFRFPTSDEWEYICGSGAQTLFRWGDHIPCDRYPNEKKSGDADWNLHRIPNSFGINIAFDPYKRELLKEPDMTRGGDGGGTICGGSGFFMGWLTLATAYYESSVCKRDPKELIDPEFTIGRRVLALK